MRHVDYHYKYITVYVYYIEISSKDPDIVIKNLTEEYEFKLKSTRPLNFHLDCDFFRDYNRTLCMVPKDYIGKMVDSY